ncbi:alpha/beta hydrolase [Nocardia sp. CA2R105]|uniref:alpha/beta hydrolase n=1 Tax=Nocardia coffeae TaxID=2873381 RepID=UPI001CA74535|nr:alpha/beta hydrolase [Nocardia coffeae]MBY8861031.1 alpha/beta hydrolase [Nocardia coffeae]
MTGGDMRPALRLAAREIPVPESVSAQARAVLALGRIAPEPQWPPLDDPDAWRALIAELDGATLRMAPGSGATAEVEQIAVGPARVYAITPDGIAPDDRRVYLEIHGGGFVQGGGEICRIRGIDNAYRVGVRSWSVDYRMPPDHPFPAASDDCLAAYRALLAQRSPEEIVIGGVSAGANLAAATVLRARDEGLPMPAGVVLATPPSDLSGSGDTWQTNLGLDNLLGSATPLQLYAAGHDPRDPYLSPVFADFHRGFPPTILLSGTRDVLLSDTVRLHRALRAADIPADLHVWEAAGHGGFLGRAPEDDERTREIRRFLATCWETQPTRP